MRLNFTLAGGGKKKSGNTAVAIKDVVGSVVKNTVGTSGTSGSGFGSGFGSGSGSGSSTAGTPPSLAGALVGGVKKGSNRRNYFGQISNPIRPKPKPAAAPTGNIRDQAVNIGNQAATRNGAENIRNTGGGRGVEIAQAVRALKGLTGR